MTSLRKETRPPVSETRRWILFISLSYLVFVGYNLMFPPPKRPVPPGARAGAAGQAGAGGGAITRVVSAADGTTRTEVVAEAVAMAPDAAATSAIAGTSVTRATRPGKLVELRTSKYRLVVDPVGAVIHSLRLTDPGSDSFRLEGLTSQGLEMVRTLPRSAFAAGAPGGQPYPLEVVLSEQGGSGGQYEDFNHVEWTAKVLSDGTGDRDVVVQLDSPGLRGLRLRKSFTFPKAGYVARVQVTVFNDTAARVSLYDDSRAQRGLGLRWAPGLFDRDHRTDYADNDAVYDTAAVRSDGRTQVLYPVAGGDALEVDGAIRWAAVQSKFFAAALVPYQPADAAKKLTYNLRLMVPNNHQAMVAGGNGEDVKLAGYHPPVVMELFTDRIDLEPNSSRAVDFEMYVGPKKYRVLKAAGHELQTLQFADATWVFGIMRPIYLALTDFLNFLYRLVGNYGIAIMVLTIVIRIMVFPLVQNGLVINARMQAEMARIKPHLDAIKEKHKDDPAEQQKRTMEVYREHGVSPFAPLRGCLPMFLQMPVFIGLYTVARDTIDLQGARFLWIGDLSQADQLFDFGFNVPLLGAHFNILPLVMGATQMAATWVSMRRVKTMDPTQKQMMYFIPAIMTFSLYTLPAGLMVYWCTSNTWQFFQTLYTNRLMDREEAKHAGGGPTIPGGGVAGPGAPGAGAGAAGDAKSAAARTFEAQKQAKAKAGTKGR